MYKEHLCHSEPPWQLREEERLTPVELLSDGRSYKIRVGTVTSLLEDRTHKALGSVPRNQRRSPCLRFQHSAGRGGKIGRKVKVIFSYIVRGQPGLLVTLSPKTIK